MLMNRKSSSNNINSQIKKIKYDYFNFNKEYKEKIEEKNVDKTERFK